jgi:arabinofuranosyltransferase
MIPFTVLLTLGLAGFALVGVAVWRKARLWEFLAVVVIAALYIVHVRYFNLLTDDAFIAFRYARNWAAGVGPVYNAGEAVEGYTSLLWVALLAGAASVGWPIPQVAVALGLGTGLFTLLIAYWFARDLPLEQPWLRWTAPLLLASSGPLALWAGGGLETALFTLLLTVAVWRTGVTLVRQEQATWLDALLSGLLWALVALARPEGVGLLAVSLVYLSVLALLCPQRRLWHLILIWLVIAGGVVTLHLGWRLSYYGYPLPNTFYAKANGGGVEQAQRGLIYLRDFGLIYGLPLFGLIGLILQRYLRRPETGYYVLVAAVYLGYVVLVGGDGLFNFRFITPLLPLLVALSVTGWGTLLNWVTGRMPCLRKWSGLVAATLVALLIGATLIPSNRGLYVLSGTTVGGRWTAIEDTRGVYRQWEAAGRWLQANTPSETLIAMQPAGLMAYYADRPVIDMLGLNDRHIAHLPLPIGAGKPGHEKWDGAYVLDRRPEIIIPALGVNPEPIAEMPDMQSIANMIGLRRVDYDLFGDRRFLMWYQPRSAQVEPGVYLNYFQRLPQPVDPLAPQPLPAGVQSLLLFDSTHSEQWQPLATNTTDARVNAEAGAVRLDCVNLPGVRDRCGFSLMFEPLQTTVLAVEFDLRIADGTRLTIDMRDQQEMLPRLVSYLRGDDQWQTLAIPVERDGLSLVVIGLGEPADLLPGGVSTYTVWVESVRVLVRNLPSGATSECGAHLELVLLCSPGDAHLCCA